MSSWLKGALVVAGFLALGASALADGAGRYGFGATPTAAQVQAWNIDVNGLTGAGLPPGHGSVRQGSDVWESKCAMCHGDFGEGNGRMPVIAGGQGTLTRDHPIKTVGSYWPYAPTLFDYIHRAMPFPAPESLTDDQVYALTAYILNLNNIIPSNAVLDAKSLAAVKMPNRDGFITKDPRPDTHDVACMRDCGPAKIVVTGDASKFKVTPATDVGDAFDSPGAAPSPAAAHAAPPASGVTMRQVTAIITQRCTVCHSAHPTQAGFTSAPGGIAFDSPAQIKSHAAAIDQQAVRTHAMPLGNMTNMTDAERAAIGRWFAAGAPVR